MGSAEPPMRYSFSYKERLHLDTEFDKAIRKGRRIFHPAILIYALERADSKETRRLGLVTSHKVGTAVERNRLKRRLREIFRLNKHLLKGSCDYVFILRKDGVKLQYSKLKSIVLGGLQKEGFFNAKDDK
jgi:ribonuclease P protein component